MKILNLQKNTTLALLLFVLILIDNYVESFSSPDFDVKNSLNFKSSPSEKLNENEIKIQKKTHLKNKINKEIETETEKDKKNLKLNSEEKEINNNQEEVSEEELKFIEEMTKSQQKNDDDSFVYASWFIFVPLVLLIFIMTILSIVGFMILILNSSNITNSELDKKEILRGRINQLNENTNGNGNGSNFINQEILEILKRKKNKKNKKKNQANSNYKPEPEPETVLLGN